MSLCSFLVVFVILFLGSCEKIVLVGPSAIVVCYTYQACSGFLVKSSVAVFMCGIVELLMGGFVWSFL
ncbi:hypothetical protein CVS40_0426 [Lucilia cuprina]|nr:hypothetical protein CVS40_0426 [Lucilia cuprina]